MNETDYSCQAMLPQFNSPFKYNNFKYTQYIIFPIKTCQYLSGTLKIKFTLILPCLKTHCIGTSPTFLTLLPNALPFSHPAAALQTFFKCSQFIPLSLSCSHCCFCSQDSFISHLHDQFFVIQCSAKCHWVASD